MAASIAIDSLCRTRRRRRHRSGIADSIKVSSSCSVVDMRSRDGEVFRDCDLLY